MVAKEKENEKRLYKIPVLHIREKIAQAKGKTGGHLPIGVLPQLRIWQQRHRTAYQGTVGMLQDLGELQE